MTTESIAYVVVFLAVLLAAAKPLGAYMYRLYGEAAPFKRLAGLDSAILRFCGVDGREMGWKDYARAFLVFHFIGVFALYVLQRLQGLLPLNPKEFAGVSPGSSFNTAISFVTNTNWQGYGGEATMSYLTQMLGLGVQNFVSAAAGIAVLFAMIRGFARQSASSIGSYWVDLYRLTVYLLLPLSFVLAIVLVSQGVIQNFAPYRNITSLDSAANPSGQVIAMGPAASQIAIKQLGTNGGGFFNANSAHPFENPTPFSNFIECLSILLISGALCYTFGKAVGDTRQGWAVLAAMTVLLVVGIVATSIFEQNGDTRLSTLGLDLQHSDSQTGGNMEGKEVRFGIGASALWAVSTTAASNGSVNSMHDSYTPLGGLVPMWLIQLGEVIYGGVGSGLYGMLMFAILAVFIAGLMIGRTPEYLGKKVEAYEVKMVSLAILITPFVVLGGTALAVVSKGGTETIWNPGAHGFSEVLYAFSSAGNNNGSAFAGLGANTNFYNSWLGIAMWLGRFTVAIPVLAIAGSLAAKKKVPVGPGTMPTHNTLFVALLIGTVLLVGALTYLPALALGPIVDHLQMAAELR